MTTQKRELDLSEAEETTLIEMRDHHVKPHLRERAAALLKVASGKSVNWVAREGLLRERKWDTVASWLNAYETEGLAGLYDEKRRGRKPAVDP
jgi:transposase